MRWRTKRNCESAVRGGGKLQEPRGGRCTEPGPSVTAQAIPLRVNCLSSL